jgi:hypothetical protein
MLMSVLDTASFVFLLVAVVLVFGVFVAFFVPHATKLSLPVIGVYVVAELAALALALMVVFQISNFDVLPTLVALAVAAVVFVPSVVAKLPIPKSWPGATKS